MWQFWIDRGGTFTDIVAKTPAGELKAYKLLSDNPEQYDDAAVYGVRDLLGLEAGETLREGTIDTVRMGTTVATNALLERSGDRTVLVTTRGLGDLLRIGYQNRPRLFDLHIRLPGVLHERVIEAEERLDANGRVVVALDEEAVARALRAAFEAGIRAVAVALMHGYRYSDHERRVAEIARAIGFSQISTSHEVSPLMKLIPRGDTTVMDAYLSPILGRYVNDVADALGADRGACRQLQFMQSNGGLTDANLFQGKDAILSGPCGGVVGMARTGRLAGFSRLIGFDMGGTSTDVCHYNGEFERTQETAVAGVRVRVPMMNIYTVAAGGGSVVAFDGARFRVGPPSAGADPGPACYRRGGPLTVTDCNVLLGRIQPAHFPRVFGESGNQTVAVDIVQQKFAALADEVNAAAESADGRAVEDVAEGFLRIAVENMANAIKKISVERGYDVTGYALHCFGGAGGQHACRVADALGMNQVLLHPLAGVLSAYGMGLADVRALRERQVEKPLDEDAVGQINELCQELTRSASQEVAQQGVASERIRVSQRVDLRYRGAHQPLTVDVGSVAAMTRAFAEAHRARFGFSGQKRQLVVEAVTVEAIGAAETITEPEVPTRPEASPIDKVRMRSQGQWVVVPVFDRAALAVDQRIEGPAIIIEPTGTNIIEAGWQARLNRFAHLLIERAAARGETDDIDTRVDPVMLEVFNNLFMSIAEQMGATLANTAYSVNIKERYDFSCALFDAEGGLVANAPHVPVHLGSMGAVVRALIQDKGDTIRPGEVYVSNVPFKGGTHLPDVTVITPVFDQAEENIIFFVGSRGHHADIGGRTPGSSPPDSTHIKEEGVLIDNVRMVADGEFQEDALRELLASGDYPCRNVDENMADLSAQVAANATGRKEIGKMVDQFGLDVVQAYMAHVQDNAEQSVRRVLDKLTDGEFCYRLDNGSRIRVAIRVDRANRKAKIDFTGTSEQVAGNYNAPLPICQAAVLYVFRTLIAEEIPLNEGCLRPLDIVAPEGSMINCRYPAAVIAGNTEVSQAICETLFGALGVLAGSQGTVNNFAYGNARYQNYETICGGTGAGPDFDGASAVHSHMTNTRLTDPEVLEFRYPVRVDKFAIRPGSGGKGRHNGGNGVVRWLRFLESMTATTLSSHRKLAPFGVAGGQPGARGRNAVRRANGQVEELEGNDQRELDADDVFIMETPGGGGYGGE